MRSNDVSRRIRFGPYEADFHTQELRKHGIRLKLSGQPLQVLEVLLSRPGELVTRAELQQLLWPGQVFVDSSHGLNAAVNKLREALSDSASAPKYIETLPRRGYRFVGAVETAVELPSMLAAGPASAVDPPRSSEEGHAEAPEIPPFGLLQPEPSAWILRLAAAALTLCVVGLIATLSRFVSPLAPFVRANASEIAEREKLAKEVLNVVPRLRNGNLETTDESTVLPLSHSLQPALRVHKLIWGEGGNAGPQFSPDGKRIAFMSNRDGPWQIWVSEADGSHPRQVSFTDSAGTPRWSPDGKSIAFDAPFDASTWIFVVRVDQSQRAQPVIEGLVPSFSRDGKWIYFASQQTGDWQVWKTSLDGSEVQVTFHGGFAALESTDGYIYYSKSRYSEPEICRIRVKGGEESCDIEHLRPRTWASWAPTREGIVFAEDMPNGKAALSLYDPARRQVRDLVLLQSAPFWVGASIDGRRAIMNDAAEQQISMVDHLH